MGSSLTFQDLRDLGYNVDEDRLTLKDVLVCGLLSVALVSFYAWLLNPDESEL